MSGIEVAGLVLGVLPIVIEGVKQYTSARSIWKRFRLKAEHMKRLVWALEEYEFCIRTDLQLVFKWSGVDAGTLNSLDFNDPMACVTDRQIGERVRHYLADAYPLYIQRLECCETIISEVARRLSGLLPISATSPTTDPGAHLQRLIDHFRSSTTSPSSFSLADYGRRLEFSISQTELEATLLELRRSAQDLRQLHAITRDLHSHAPRATSFLRLMGFYEQIQLHATIMFSVITSVMPLSCPRSHILALYLDERSTRTIEDSARISYEIGVACFSHVQQRGIWHDSPVTLIDPPIQTMPGTRPSRFEVPGLSSECVEVGQLCDLARTLRTGQYGHRSVTLHFWEGGNLLYSPNNGTARRVEEWDDIKYVDLSTILSRIQLGSTRDKRWSLSDRMQLAYKLASSLLQLKRTPWVEQSLRAKDVLFLQRDTDELPFDAGHPFVARFDPDDRAGHQPISSVDGLLLDLGVLLLEIWERKPFHQWVEERHFSSQDVFETRIQAARAWVKDIHLDMPSLYRNATIQCIGSAGLRLYEWHHEDFRQKYSGGVLLPLWENSNFMRKGP